MADIRPEPSMEDILASIKRIIADDNPMPRRSYTPPVPAAASPVLAPAERRPIPPLPPMPQPSVQWPEPRGHDDSVLELTNRAPSPIPPLPPVAIPAHLHDQQKPWPPQEAPAVSRVVDRLRQSEAASAQARAASVAAAAPEPLEAVASITVPETPSKSLPPLAAAASGVTLEALVREMLRPMLTEWIDTHMPSIVEKLVRQEISGASDE